MKIIIGSYALRILKGTYYNDIDIVADYDEMPSISRWIGAKVQYPINSGKSVFMKGHRGQIVEVEVAWPDSMAEKFLSFAKEFPQHFTEVSGYLIPDINVLYMLKMSHRYKKNSPHFHKTMADIWKLRSYGCDIVLPEFEEFYQERMKDTYTNSLPKLNVKKGEFFSGDGIEYKFDHDSLHEAVKFMEKPAYKYYTTEEVWSDMKLFKQCSKETQLYGVLEEALVLAAERSQLMFTPRPDPDWSFKYALEKVCTSITSGVFRETAWEAYHEVVALYEKVGKGYMDKVDRGISSGLVRRLG